MANPNHLNEALDLSQIKDLTKSMESQILLSPAFLNKDIFAGLDIDVLQGIEFQTSQYTFFRKGGTTRPYVVGAQVNNKIGKMTENILEVKLAWNRIVDNIQNYREKEPFHVDLNGKYVAPNSQMAIKAIAESFAEDVLVNLFHGKYAEGGTSVLNCYDGFLRHITTKGLWKSQVIATEAFGDDSDKSADWNNFVNFVSSLPVPLQRAMSGNTGVNVYVDKATYTRIINSFALTFPAMKPSEVVNNFSVQFLNLGNVKLIGNNLIGTGSFMLATTPKNLQFGVDNLNNMAGVEVDRDNNDFNNIIYQIQSAQGTRIKRMDEVAINDKINTFDSTLYTGDYTAATENLTEEELAELTTKPQLVV